MNSDMNNQTHTLSDKAIGVFCGGNSNEREISLRSGKAIFDALYSNGFKVRLIDIQDLLLHEFDYQNLDIVFIALHGSGGEDGSIQGVLDFRNMPYTGSKVEASKLAISKYQSKKLWRKKGIKTADFVILNKDNNWLESLESLGGSVMVKPDTEGSSLGVTQAFNTKQLQDAFRTASKFSERVIAEKLLTGPEYTVAILDGEALPSIQIRSQSNFYDFESKYLSDKPSFICPSGLSAFQEEEIQLLALKAFNSLGCEGWGRVDLMSDDTGAFNVLEVNTVPGMTKKSLFPKAAEVAGISFENLVVRILETTKL